MIEYLATLAAGLWAGAALYIAICYNALKIYAGSNRMVECHG